MALETLKDFVAIGGFAVGRTSGWRNKTDGHGEFLKHVVINDDTNSICFRIQDGPIKENGINGCQVDTMIEAAKLIIEGLNQEFPHPENAMCILKLDAALDCLQRRKKDREKRQVEGTNQV